MAIAIEFLFPVRSFIILWALMSHTHALILLSPYELTDDETLRSEIPSLENAPVFPYVMKGAGENMIFY